MYKRLFEEELLSYWEVCDQLGISKEAKDLHDVWIKWHNRNNPTAILKIIKNKKFTRT